LRKLDRFRKISPRIPVFIDPCSIQVSVVQFSSRNCVNMFTGLKASIENEKVKYTEHMSTLTVSIPQKQRSCIGTHRTPWTLHLEKTISVPKWSQATDKFHCGQLLYWIWRLSFQYPQRLSKGTACPILQGPVECKPNQPAIKKISEYMQHVYHGKCTWNTEQENKVHNSRYRRLLLLVWSFCVVKCKGVGS
jgi:hypothetical protein